MKTICNILLEEWKSIEGWELFEVSNFGRVRRKSRPAVKRYTYKGQIIDTIPERILAPGDRRYVDLQELKNDKPRVRYSIAELVLTAFDKPRPKGALALHFDDDQTNNRIDNLRWGTYSDNLDDAYRNNPLRIEKVSKSNKGKKRTPDQCKNIGNGRRGKFPSEITKERMRQAAIKRHASMSLEERRAITAPARKAHYGS